MMNITFGGFNLNNGSTTFCGGIQHENVSQKSLNVQKYGLREGGRFAAVNFDIKIITLSGYLKESTQANLEALVDTLKKNLNRIEKDLDIEYRSGIRRFKATMTRLEFDRQHWNINYLPWTATFQVSDPPLGKSIDTATMEDLGNTISGASTVTGEITGPVDFVGTFRPRPIIKITFTGINGFRKLDFDNTDDDGVFSRTRIAGLKLYDGDVITIDVERSEVALNGYPTEYIYGLPHFTLTGNQYTLAIVAQDYNVDLKIIYVPFWL